MDALGTTIKQDDETGTRGMALLRRILGLRGRRSLDLRSEETAPSADLFTDGTMDVAPVRTHAPPSYRDLAAETQRYTVESSVFPALTVDAISWSAALQLALQILEREDRWPRLAWTLGEGMVIATDPETGERYEVPLHGRGWGSV